ncbi:MAG TPA: TIGR01777 family oxidoreductase [Pyrinomonadaceae bacterium]|nr:TIGR01777 family oxidoreductase [Pyrinomonadaceae bacterium]
MKVLVTGSHGLVGRAFIKSLLNKGDTVARLVRGAPSGSNDIEWHPNQGQIDAARLDGFDAVVHLAGESIASGRWSAEKKERIRDSRIKGTHLLSNVLAQTSKPPSVFVSASAIGYYGDRGDDLLTEESSPGRDFLANVCKDWEAATEPAGKKGIRLVKARLGIVLDKDAGALAKMLPPFRMGIGGRIGDGKQWMSWIALTDVVGALQFVIENQVLSGPVNFVAPNPVTNATFTSTLGKILGRPTFLPIPAFGARLAFGEMADALLLSSQRVEPTRLKETAFQFKYTNLNDALSQILK